MWNEILNLAIKNGLWAVLFLGLFIFVIKDSSNREKKYQSIIEELTTHLGVVNQIKKEVDNIKDIVLKPKNSKHKSTAKPATKENSNNETKV